VSDSSVMEALERRLGGRPQEIAKTIKRVSAQDKVEREMLKLLARNDQMYRAYVGRLEPDHFRNAGHKRTFQAIVQANGDIGVIAGGEDAKLTAAVSSLAVEELDGEPDAEYARSVWMRLQEFLLKSKSDAMRMRLQKLNPTTDLEYDDLFRELVAVDGDLRRLRHTDPDVG